MSADPIEYQILALLERIATALDATPADVDLARKTLKASRDLTPKEIETMSALLRANGYHVS